MGNEEEEKEKASWVTNTCLRCDKKFTIKDWKLDDVRFKRFCNSCKSTIDKRSRDVEFTDVF